MVNIKTNNARKDLEVTCDKTYLNHSYITYAEFPAKKNISYPLIQKHAYL